MLCEVIGIDDGNISERPERYNELRPFDPRETIDP